MTLGRWWPGALALGVLAAGLAAWTGRSGDAPAPPPPAAALHALPQPLPATRRSSLARPAAASTPAELPLAAQVDRLLASHDPEDAYAAYRLIADCAEFSDKHDRMVFDRREAARAPKDTFMAGYRGMTDDEKRHDAVFCANLTERQRQSRLDALAVAAQAGVSGAAVAFLDAGPFGDPSALKTRPDDPLVQAWKATATAQLQLAADAGDVGTLFSRPPCSAGPTQSPGIRSLPIATAWRWARSKRTCSATIPCRAILRNGSRKCSRASSTPLHVRRNKPARTASPPWKRRGANARHGKHSRTEHLPEKHTTVPGRQAWCSAAM